MTSCPTTFISCQSQTSPLPRMTPGLGSDSATKHYPRQCLRTWRALVPKEAKSSCQGKDLLARTHCLFSVPARGSGNPQYLPFLWPYISNSFIQCINWGPTMWLGPGHKHEDNSLPSRGFEWRRRRQPWDKLGMLRVCWALGMQRPPFFQNREGGREEDRKKMKSSYKGWVKSLQAPVTGREQSDSGVKR